MHYRLDELAAVAAELGFDARRVDTNRLDVLLDEAVLTFCNLSEDADSAVGFDGTPWHFVHGMLRDRWLAHRDEPLNLRYIEPGEELRVRRVAQNPGGR